MNHVSSNPNHSSNQSPNFVSTIAALRKNLKQEEGVGNIDRVFIKEKG